MKINQIMPWLRTRLQWLCALPWLQRCLQGLLDGKQWLSDRLQHYWLVDRSDAAYEFLPGYLEVLQRPPAPWARQLALMLSALLLAAVLWSIFGKLDIHASASGQIMTSSRSKVIQPLEQAEVVAIHVQDGTRVRAGTPLVDLKLVGAGADVLRLQSQVMANRLEVARLSALLTDDPVGRFQAPAGVDASLLAATKAHLQSEWQARQSQDADLNAQIAVAAANTQATKRDVAELEKLQANVNSRIKATQALADQGVVSKVSMLEKGKELLEINQKLEQQRQQVNVLSAQRFDLLERKRSTEAQTRRDYSDKLTQTSNTLAEMEQELAKAQERHGLQHLVSPVDGVVQQLAVHTVGGVVTSAQSLMVVVPAAAELEAEVNILNKDVGFVLPGQKVEVKVDAFPYSRYGTVPATLAFVSHDAVKDDRLGYVFPARVKLSKPFIMVDGRAIPLQAGMSVVAEVETGYRRIIDYVLSPIREYQNTAMRER